MTTEQKDHMAMLLVKRFIKHRFKEPNSDDSRRMARRMAITTGISHPEIHRFHNAVINDNAEHSFKPERAKHIARAIMKEICRDHGLPNDKARGRLGLLANELGIALNDLLEFMRELYNEIIDSALQPQSK